MRKSILFLLSMLVAFVSVGSLTSCDDDETYADQKDREREAINAYIVKNGIKVISEQEFQAKDSVTDVSKNEYVLFENTGVYMQIVRKGCGKKLKNGETSTILCRFDETNLLTDSLQLSNNNLYWSAIVDKMTVNNTSGTFTAWFDTSSSLMYTAYGKSYGTTAVPNGWLVPLTYINIGRPSEPGDQIAKVNLIVPHTQGQYYASANVYPCLYNITYERGR